ncbi:MAG: LON peptidase substrate-binding domain-containing protein [Cycloclasticus sp.]
MQWPTDNIPIFPLSTVLFPEGAISLRIFETRYLDMVSQCLKQDVPFGVSMIVEGSEVGKAAQCYEIGTLANISNWDRSADGVLQIEALGSQRFRILQSHVSEQQLITATIKVIDELPNLSVPNELLSLTTLLRKALQRQQFTNSWGEAQFDNANWVSYRLAEVLPIENVIRQRLLEINNPIERLHIILGLFSEY